MELFTPTALEQKWASRVTALLAVPVEKGDGLPSCICRKCKARVEVLEKSAADLASFKQMAECSRSTLGPLGPLKRTKVTSGEVGVSPDTVRQRPSSKLSRKRLDFDGELFNTERKNNV